MLSGEVTTEEYEVQEVTYSIHTKRGADESHPKSMRVEYQTALYCWQSEWVCPEHTGYAQHKFEAWWQKRSNWPVPVTTADAVRIAREGGLAKTRKITVRSIAGEKYDRIVGYRLGPKPADGCDREGYVLTEAIPF